MAERKITVMANPTKAQSVAVTPNSVQTYINATPDTSLYYSTISKKWAVEMGGLVNGEDYSAKHYAGQSAQSATEAQNFAEQAENSKDELLNDTGFVAVKDNLDNIITTAVNIEDINITAENIEAIKDASLLKENLDKVSENLPEIETNAENIDDIKANAENIEAIKNASTIALDKADRDLTNLSEAGEKHFLNKSQITTCLLEVPQRIKLELNNGVLTLKAGSEVIVPNGFEADGVTPKFDYVTIESDLTTTGISYNKPCFIMYDHLNKSISIRDITQCQSGTSTPTSAISGVYIYYNTSKNKFYLYTNNAWTARSIALPLCIVNMQTATPYITSIDQVFNGMGYIGSTVWVGKGVKGLIPNGRNEDGSLKNAEFVTKQLFTYTTPNITGKKVSPCLYMDFPTDPNIIYNGEIKGIDYIGNPKIGGTPLSVDWWFDVENNYWKYNGVISRWVPFGLFDLTNGVISNFQPKLPFRAVDYNDVVKKAGDTMTGTLSVQFPTNYDYTSTTAPSTEIVAGEFSIKDENGKSVTTLQNHYNIYNNMVTRLYTTRNVGGVDMIAALQLYVGADGTAKFDFPKCTAKATTSSTAHNGNVAVITQNYKNGHSWYRVWSDGWIEQGGRIQTTATGTITFPKAFTGSDYKMLTNIINMTANQPKTVYLHTNTTTSIVFDCRSQSGQGASQEACTFVWYACGY